MPNLAAPPLVDSIKMIAQGVMNHAQLTDITTGVVVKVNPLEIRIDQINTLTAQYLELTNAVRDYEVDVTVSMQTVADKYLKAEHTHGNGNNGSPTSSTSDFDTTHHHDIKGRKKITVHNGLTVGESVLLLRKQGAQKYIVLDRVQPAITSGEWL